MGTLRMRLAAVGALAAVLTVPLSFVYGGVIQSGLASVLGLRVKAAFSGGEELARFRDPAGDDAGAGGLVYPLHPGFAPGSLDLVRYAVHQPQVGAPWSEPADFWQLSASFAALPAAEGGAGFSGPELAVYIDTGEGGSTQTADPRSALVTFDPAHAWDWVVTADGSRPTARLRSADGTVDRAVPLFVDLERRRLTLRLPLDTPGLSRVLDGRPTWHYVLVGAHDALAAGGFMALRENPGLGAGGGAVSRLTPRVFDVLVPKGRRQDGMLASFDEAAGTPALLEPVAVPGFDPAGPGRAGPFAAAAAAEGDAAREARIAALAAEAAREGERERAAAAAKADDPAASPLAKAVALFGAGRGAEAAKAFDAVLAAEPGNPTALAYRGALRAQEGGAAGSPGEAVRLVNEGYALMDRAVAEAGPADLPAVWIARGSVSLAVPQDVFGKARQGAEDFQRAAEWFAAQGDDAASRAGRADCLVKAGMALEKAGDADGAELWFQRAAALPDLPAGVGVELARRSF